MSLLDQSGVTGGGLDPYNVHALLVNMDNMWMEQFGNYDCLVSTADKLCHYQSPFRVWLSSASVLVLASVLWPN